MKVGVMSPVAFASNGEPPAKRIETAIKLHLATELNSVKTSVLVRQRPNNALKAYILYENNQQQSPALEAQILASLAKLPNAKLDNANKTLTIDNHSVEVSMEPIIRRYTQ